MPNPPAIAPGTVYHIFNRGNNRENLFRERRNYDYFLRLYLHHVAPIVDTYAYCLLRNRFHLLVRIKNAQLFEHTPPHRYFAVFFNAYAKGINKAYHRSGSLFQNPFGRVVISSDAQLTSVIRYIHHNPQKHKLIEDFRNWPYSSYAALQSDEPTFLNRNAVHNLFGGRAGFSRFHAEPISFEIPESQSPPCC